MEHLKKLIITRYDETITEPPFLTIPIDECDIMQPDNDDYGEIFARRLKNCCMSLGYVFQFYTRSGDGVHDYEVVVYK